MAIDVNELTVNYGAVRAVKGISFSVADSAFFAFIGVNGAGKSTTINCLTTLLRASSGYAQIDGHLLGRENSAIRHSIGVVFQNALLDPRLTVRENIKLRATLHGIEHKVACSRISDLISLLNMASFVDQQYRTLSGGQKRRADIARALIHRPRILFLDEPTTGLDPASREQVWKAITDVRDHEGMTIFLTTHYMAETERCDEVCVIHSGRIVTQGTPAELRERYSTGMLSLKLASEEALHRVLSQHKLAAVPAQCRADEYVKIPVPHITAAKRILGRLWDDVSDFEYVHGTMDDVFLNLTGQVESGELAASVDSAPAASNPPIVGRSSIRTSAMVAPSEHDKESPVSGHDLVREWLRQADDRRQTPSQAPWQSVTRHSQKESQR